MPLLRTISVSRPETARKAVTLDENDSVSLTVLGRILLYKGDYEKGEHFLRKSLRLNLF